MRPPQTIRNTFSFSGMSLLGVTALISVATAPLAFAQDCSDSAFDKLSSSVDSASDQCNAAQEVVEDLDSKFEDAKEELNKTYQGLIGAAKSESRKKTLAARLVRAQKSLDTKYNGKRGLIVKAQVKAKKICDSVTALESSLSKLEEACSKASPGTSTTPNPTTPTTPTTPLAADVRPVATLPAGTAGGVMQNSSPVAPVAVVAQNNGRCTGNCGASVPPTSVASTALCDYSAGATPRVFPCYENGSNGYTIRYNSGSGTFYAPTVGTAPTGNFKLPPGASIVSVYNPGFTPVDATQDFGPFYNASRFNVADTSTYVTYQIGNQTSTSRVVELPNYAPALCKEESANAINGGGSDPCSMRSATNSSICLGIWDTAKCQ